MLAVGGCAGSSGSSPSSGATAISTPPTVVASSSSYATASPTTETMPPIVLAAAPGASKVATSIGTLAFTTWQLPAGRQFYRSVATDHGVVAVEPDSDALYWSTDLVTWHGTPTIDEPWAVYRVGDQVVVTGQGGTARYGWNGSGWIESSRLNLPGVIERLVSGPHGSVAVVGSSYYRSDDGVHFTPAQRPPSKDRLLATGSGGCAGGFMGSGPADVAAPVLATSTGFVALTPAHPADWQSTPVCDPVLWTSTDGSQWSPASTSSFGTGAFVDAIAEHDGRFVAVGGSDHDHAALWVSDDGLRWTRSTLSLAGLDQLVGPGLTVSGGPLGWIVTGRWSVSGSDRLGSAFWTSSDGRTFQGPYPLPDGLRSGYIPALLTIGRDTIFGVGGDLVPVSARLAPVR
jgi:hypothetical protein